MQLQSIEDIQQKHRHIYLSPHFDDAVLSCGGSIAMQTQINLQPLIITIFAAPPADGAALSAFAKQVQTSAGLGESGADAVARRREEDRAACEYIGADYLWLNYADAIYRGYDSGESLFCDINRNDLDLEETLAQVMLKIHELAPNAVIYAPLGVGHHVDHQLVTSAAARLINEKVNIKFYEDIPYVTKPNTLQTRQTELKISMEPEMNEVSFQLDYKLNATALYASQIAPLFKTEDVMRREITAYSKSIKPANAHIAIERFWAWDA